MREYGLTIESAADGLPLSVLVIAPDEEPKAILQLVHGMAEHKERYRELMTYMSTRGAACIIHDHRGHGGSVREAGDLGYFYESGAHGTVKDIEQIGDYADELFGGVPRYLFGHSMGSLAVRAYTAEHDNEIAALIVCGSPSYQRAAPLGCVLADVLSFFKGDKYRSSFINQLAFGAYHKYTGESTPFNWISYSKENQQAFINDALCGFTFTLNGFKALFSLMQMAYSPKYWDVNHKSLPILFVSGEDDPCAVSKARFNDAVQFMRDMGYQNVSAKLYPNMRHEILNEANKHEVMQDMAEFLNLE